jgi:hypothetical protein
VTNGSAGTRYLIALSFPGEYRERVAAVADLLVEAFGPRIFFDGFESVKADVARFNADLLLQDVYLKQAELVVVFVGGEYQAKPWCREVEFSAIRSRTHTQGSDSVMLVRLADGDVSGILPFVDAAYDARRASAKQIAAAISFRVRAESLVTNASAPRASPPIRKKRTRGVLVPRMCDRDAQEQQFLRFFWDNIRRQIPQVYLIRGDERESHDSFVERLYKTQVKRLVERDAGKQRTSTDYCRVRWPEGGSFESRERDLRLALFRELDRRYERESSDFSPAALCRLVHGRRLNLAMVHHPIPASLWDDVTTALLRWYLNFWAESVQSTPRPQFVVVIDVLYPKQEDDWRFAATEIVQRMRRVWIKRRVAADFGSFKSTPACFVAELDELRCVGVSDVVEWFRRHDIYDSDKTRFETADRLFRTSNGTSTRCRNMSEIEPELCRIHAEFVNRERSLAW